MFENLTSGVLILLAVASLAASLVCLAGVGGKRSAHSAIVGAGFALLAGCFAWLWAL